MFLQDSHWEASTKDYVSLKAIYEGYRRYCNDNGYHSCALNTFSERIREQGFKVQRKNKGNVVWMVENLPNVDSAIFEE